MFSEIDLLTGSGEFVAKAKVLSFLRPPEVILWGERFFVQREDGKYYEGFVAFAMGTVEENKPDRPGEPQTCPRRAEGPGWGVEGEDRWDTSHWKFTDAEAAAKFNQEEADRENAKARARGQQSTSHPNLRYWLWPGPGPKPRSCSFCGCVHPEDAIRLVKEFKFTVKRSTKGYKVYLHPPGYEIGVLEAHVNMQAGVDPIEALGAQRVQDVSPPLKAYSPHFTVDQWKDLIS
jgi:hypothetical protein